MARETAIYFERDRIIYPTLGLAGEIGEIANKVKKIFRDDAGQITDEKRAELKKELGDACWYISALASDAGITLLDTDSILPKFLPDLSACVLKMVLTVGVIAHKVEQWPYVALHITENLQYLCSLCAAVAYHIGADFGDVLQANIDKLLSRKERGTLQGSGDNR